jgi:3-oxoacyl-[acyl-carrier protein] reductase
LNRPLAGRFAVVTGGTRGIGFAIADRLIADGARVLVTGRTDSGQCPPGASTHAVDFASPTQLDEFCDVLQAESVDILVNNAGINAIAPFASITTTDFDRVLNVNLRAPFLLTRAALPSMQRAGWGRIVNIASIFSVVSRSQRAAYSASKFGLDGLTAALAAEVVSDGILANCVSPGFIDTELTRRILGDDGVRAASAAIPAQRLGTAKEVASLVAWLAGPENTYVSGQNFVVDGGFSRV